METSDFNKAAFLLARDFPIKDTTRQGRRMTFHFSDTKEINDAVREFNSGQSTIQTNAFISAQNHLRSVIYDTP